MKRTELIETIELLKPAVAIQEIVPIFTHCCFDGERIYAYKDDLCISAPCEDSGEFALHTNTLLGLLKNSRASDVDFTPYKDEIVTKVGKSTVKLPFYPKSEFLFEEPDDSWEVELDLNEATLAGIETCLLTSSKDMSMPSLAGITLDTTNDPTFYSCDGDAITQFNLNIDKKEGGAVLTIPNDACEALLKISSKTKTKQGTISISTEWAKMELANGYKIYGRVIVPDEPFNFAHEIKQAIKDEPDYVGIPKGLDDALARACVIADPEAAPTEIKVKEEKLRLSTESYLGSVKDVFRLRKHKDVEAIISASLMRRSLSVTNEMAILENCCCYRGENTFIVVGNMGE